MPTSSAMMTTMLGFLAVVCADAVLPRARGIAMIAVARRLRMNIDISFHLPDLRAGQPTNSSPQEVGQQREIAHVEKRSIDQRGNELWRGQHRSRLINSSENSESLRNLGAFSF